jgi:hypothetical protein
MTLKEWADRVTVIATDIKARWPGIEMKQSSGYLEITHGKCFALVGVKFDVDDTLLPSFALTSKIETVTETANRKTWLESMTVLSSILEFAESAAEGVTIELPSKDQPAA